MLRMVLGRCSALAAVTLPQNSGGVGDRAVAAILPSVQWSEPCVWRAPRTAPRSGPTRALSGLEQLRSIGPAADVPPHRPVRPGGTREAWFSMPITGWLRHLRARSPVACWLFLPTALWDAPSTPSSPRGRRTPPPSCRSRTCARHGSAAGPRAWPGAPSRSHPRLSSCDVTDHEGRPDCARDIEVHPVSVARRPTDAQRDRTHRQHFGSALTSEHGHRRPLHARAPVAPWSTRPAGPPVRN